MGGGVKEPGWLNTQLSKSWLAVVPGYSHYNLITSPEVPQIVAKFLADPLTKPPTGAWPASICFFSPSPCTHSPAEHQQACSRALAEIVPSASSVTSASLSTRFADGGVTGMRARAPESPANTNARLSCS